MNINAEKLQGMLSKIGKSMYVCSEDIPEDEKWSIQSKLRTRSSDVISWTAEAVGSIDPRDIKWALGKARASLAVVEATYRHAADIGLITIDPEVMVWIEQSTKDIDNLIEQATKGIPVWFEEMDQSAQKGSKT